MAADGNRISTHKGTCWRRGWQLRRGESLLPVERIERAILFVRGEKVMLDRDLATLYDVETRALVQAVKRNLRCFPPDFMFQLSKEELAHWRSQFVMSNPAAKMGLRRRPYASTEQGFAMLSSVLHSERAVLVTSPYSPYKSCYGI